MHEGQWYQDHTWLTPGCVTESYGSHSINECMTGRKVVFVGDETIQGVYWAMRLKLDRDTVLQPASHDSHYSNDHIELEYIWDPFFNGTKLHRYTGMFRDRMGSCPTLMILGSGRWYAQNDAVDQFLGAVDYIASIADPGNRRSGIGLAKFSTDNGTGDLLLFAPVQEPYTELTETSPRIDAYRDMNAHLMKRASENAIDLLWSFNHMTVGRKDKYYDNGVDVQWEVLHQRVDLLVSLRCNALFAQTRNFPNIRTCCGTWNGPNWIQASFLLVGLGILPAIVLLDYRWQMLRDDDRMVVRAFCAFTSTISLQYITDRTHIFQQVQRLPLVTDNLRNMIIVAGVISFVTIRRCKSSPKTLNLGDQRPDQPFLPRDQTDEWKGWMQLLIIIYHYNMAWTADWYWEIIRVAVASYLFLTGFGHTVYFLQKKDYSFRRVVAVMIRTNLLPCTLAYVMRTRWLLYYYMPLSSFWFLIVYATLAIGSAYNRIMIFVVCKILTSAYLVHVFISIPDLPETFVRLFALIFKTSFDANAFFHHRIKIDPFIVYVGMLVAILYIWIKAAISQSESQHGTLSKVCRWIFPWLKYVAMIVSLFGFVTFWYLVHFRIHSQGDWTERQPYITFIPILAFLVLRNAHSSLRNFHSFAFAWLGRYSGEMYVMQDHIWLAGDQEAVLRTGLFYGDDTVPYDRWRDLLLITPLYLIACCIIGDATTIIATWFVADSPARETGKGAGTEVVNELEMSLLLETGEANDGEQHNEKLIRRSMYWVTLRDVLWPDRVRDRAILVLVWMWFLNLVSVAFHY